MITGGVAGSGWEWLGVAEDAGSCRGLGRLATVAGLMIADPPDPGTSRPRRERVPALLLQGAVALGLVVATTAFVTSDKTVTVSVEGQGRQVRTFASTVGDLLADEGLSVDTTHDLVIPTAEQPLRDGETIVVRYGRPVLLTVDGRTRTVWTTADSVADALVMLCLLYTSPSPRDS